MKILRHVLRLARAVITLLLISTEKLHGSKKSKFFIAALAAGAVLCFSAPTAFAATTTLSASGSYGTSEGAFNWSLALPVNTSVATWSSYFDDENVKHYVWDYTVSVNVTLAPQMSYYNSGYIYSRVQLSAGSVSGMDLISYQSDLEDSSTGLMTVSRSGNSYIFSFKSLLDRAFTQTTSPLYSFHVQVITTNDQIPPLTVSSTGADLYYLHSEKNLQNTLIDALDDSIMAENLDLVKQTVYLILDYSKLIQGQTDQVESLLNSCINLLSLNNSQNLDIKAYLSSLADNVALIKEFLSNISDDNYHAQNAANDLASQDAAVDAQQSEALTSIGFTPTQFSTFGNSISTTLTGSAAGMSFWLSFLSAVEALPGYIWTVILFSLTLGLFSILLRLSR